MNIMSIEILYLERSILIRKFKQSLYNYCQENPDKAYLLDEWDYEENEKLGFTPKTIGSSSGKKVSWICSKDKRHKWTATLNHRISGRNCPYCSSRKLFIGENDLASQRPDLAKEWHPIKNGKLTPDKVFKSSNKEVWWQCSKNPKHIWKATVNHRYSGYECPYCSNQKILIGDNDLATTHPELEKEWDYEKNYPITPQEVTSGSDKKVWWICKTCGHEWFATIFDRAKGRGCRLCSYNRVVKGVNDLATTHPNLAAQWHPTKNGNLKPTDVVKGSEKNVWWLCPDCGHEWQATITGRRNGLYCPHCNQTSTSYPEMALFYYISLIYSEAIHRYKINNIEFDIFIPSLNLAIEYDGYYWHKEKLEKENKKDQFCKDNGIRLIRLRSSKLEPTILAENIFFNETTYKSISKSFSAFLNYLDCEYNFEIDLELDYNQIIDMELLEEKENSLAVNFPELCKEIHPTLNNKFNPYKISSGSHIKIWWKCSECNHEWKTSIKNRTLHKSGCPACAGIVPIKGKTDLATKFPEVLKYWDYDKNSKIGLTPDSIGSGSNKKVFWKCPECNYCWSTTISNKIKSTCPKCTGNIAWTEEEIEILEKYYPTEGSKITEQLPNRTKSSIIHKASKLGIKYKG